VSTNRVAAPWQRTRVDRYLVRRGAESDKAVALVYPGPAGTFSTRTIARPGERTYGYATEHDAQRWADFELGDAGFKLTTGPLDPPPLVERRERGCLGATLGLMALGVALVAAAVGVGVWL